MKKSKRIVRKPVNLVTQYWDDMEEFLSDAEKADSKYKAYLSSISEQERALPKLDTWGCRYTILSSFLYLEALINLEYFNYMFPSISPRELKLTQKATLDKKMRDTPFDRKWSTWIETIVGRELNLRECQEHKELMLLKGWRNYLTHYKIQHMLLIHEEIETIEKARDAKRIAIQSTKWYYDITQIEPAEWIQRDILGML